MDNKAVYIGIAKAAELLDKTQDTLRRWEREGKIASKRIIPGGKRFYNILEVVKLMKETKEEL